MLRLTVPVLKATSKHSGLVNQAVEIQTQHNWPELAHSIPTVTLSAQKQRQMVNGLLIGTRLHDKITVKSLPYPCYAVCVVCAHLSHASVWAKGYVLGWHFLTNCQFSFSCAKAPRYRVGYTINDRGAERVAESFLFLFVCFNIPKGIRHS